MPPHSLNGKAAYAEIATYFALNGYAVLTFDLLAKASATFSVSMDGGTMFSSTEHYVLGPRWRCGATTCNGLCFMMSRGRGLDRFLQGTGPSGLSRGLGGGNASFYAAALDERIKVVAPGGFGSQPKQCFPAGGDPSRFISIIFDGDWIIRMWRRFL